jgi:hypothetical protein
MNKNRTGARYLWVGYLLCLLRGHQAPYKVETGGWKTIGASAVVDGSDWTPQEEIQVWYPIGEKLVYVCPRCGDDVRTPERETF